MRITENDVGGPKYRGISVYAVWDSALVDANYVEGADDGGTATPTDANISVANSVRVTRNFIYYVGQYGVYVDNAALVWVTDNFINCVSIAGSYGIRAAGANTMNVYLDHNTIHHAGFDGIKLDGTITVGPVSTSNNIIYKCGYSGIRSSATRTRIHDNTLYNNATEGAGAYWHAGISGYTMTHTSIRDNDVYDDQGGSATQDFGINLEQDCDFNTVRDNDVGPGHLTRDIRINNANNNDNVVKDNRMLSAIVGFEDDGTDTVLASKPFQFIKELNGSYETTSPTGILIDAATEAAILQGHIPGDAQQVMRLRLFAVAKGAPIGTPGQMHLDATFNAGSPNAAYNTAATSWVVVSKDGEETDYVADDVVTWVLTDADTGDSELSALVAGGKFELIVLYRVGDDPDGATNAVFGSMSVEYV